MFAKGYEKYGDSDSNKQNFTGIFSKIFHFPFELVNYTATLTHPSYPHKLRAGAYSQCLHFPEHAITGIA